MHAKSKITGILPKGFKAQKCKTSLKMAVSRIKLLKNKKEVSVKQLRRELAQLLETGQEQTARIRVEHVIREEKTMSAYDLIEVYCELIAARLPIIESQKSCPLDLKEAISSVIFSAPRCSDIQELTDIRKHFTAKYGKEFVTAALEVRPECGVSRMMVEKLSAKAPDVELKIKVLKDVAAEHNINWEPKPFEDIQNPKEGLLNGPTSFTSGNTVKAEPSNLQSSSTHIWEDEPSRKVSENFVSTKPASYNIPHISGSSRISEKMSGDDEVRQAYSKESPLNWSTKYKDAASAAEAAAESAERASIAARAAAELASRERISRQHSADSYTMPTNTAKSQGSGSQKNSKLEASRIMSESTNIEDDDKRSTSITKTAIHKQVKVDQATKGSELDSRHSTSEIFMAEKTHHIDSSFRESMSENELQEDDWELYDNEAQMGFTDTGAAVKDFQQKKEDYNQMPDNLNKKSNASLFRESISKDELQEDDWELYDKPQKGVRDAGAAGKDFHQKNEDGNQMPDNLNEKSKESAPTYDGYSMWDDHESTAIHFSEVAFDRSDSDSDDHSFQGSYAKENLFDSVLRQKEQPSHLSADIYSSRTKHMSESLFNQSSSQMRFVAEDQDSHSASTKRILEDNLPSQVKDSTQPSYDSYGPSSESEDDIEAKQPIPLHSQSSYEKSPSSVISGHKSASMHEQTEVVEDTWSFQPVVSPGVKDTHLEVESSSLEKSWRRPGLSVRNSQQTQISGRSPTNLDSRGGLTEEVTSDSGISEESYESGGLRMGNIIPGSRNKRDNQPPYIGNSAVNVYDDSQQKKKGMISDVAEIPTSRVTLKEKATKELHAKDYTPKSSSLKSYEAAYFEKNKPSRNTIMDETSNFGGSTASGMSMEDITHYGKMPEDEDDPVQAYLQQRRKKQQNEVTYQSSSRNIMSHDFEEHNYSVPHGHHGNRTSIPKNQDAGTSASTDHRRSGTLSFEVPVAEMYDKKPHIRPFDESSSNMTMRYSDLDDNDAGQSEPTYTVAKSVDKNVKLSRRTKPMASDIKEKSSMRTTRSTITESPIEKETRSSQRQSAFESFPIEAKQSRELDVKVQLNHKHPYLSDDEPSIKNLDVESSTRKSISKSSQQEKIDDGSSTPSSSGKTTSREGSLKAASHTHPKLPDYESLAAHFQSLRANVRK